MGVLNVQRCKTNSTLVPLGRWSIETCHKKVNNKIDLANEDHCGPCGKYIIDKINITTVKNNKKI
jgi:hypothetical protein